MCSIFPLLHVHLIEMSVMLLNAKIRCVHLVKKATDKLSQVCRAGSGLEITWLWVQAAGAWEAGVSL